MGNNQPKKHQKPDQIADSFQVGSEDHSDSLELDAVPSNEVDMYGGVSEDSISESGSNRNSAEQAVKICMEYPNCVTDLSKNIDKQVLIFKKEYREAMLSNITNISNEIAEIHFDSDYLYL